MNSIEDIRIAEAYERMCRSVHESRSELESLKHRLDSMTPQQVYASFDQFELPYGDKVDALMDSGAFVRHISKGSSRTTFLTKDGTVLKIADNPNGLAQNSAESRNAAEKNDCGCFARVLWKSRNNFALEEEYAEPISGDEDEFADVSGGIDFWKYYNLLKYARMSSVTPKKRDDTYRALQDRRNGYTTDMRTMERDASETLSKLKSPPFTYVKKVLLGLPRYMNAHNSTDDLSVRDIGRLDNWGKVVRYGQTALVVTDHGASDRILNRNYAGVTSAQMHAMYGR